MSKKKYIVANWKMNPGTWKEAKDLFNSVKKKSTHLKKAVPVLCVPSLYLNCINESYRGKKVKLGGQDISQFEKTGSHTGEVSVQMLKSSGASYMIVGHSERRKMGEDDEIVRKKLQISLESGLTTILCIGEASRDREGQYLGFIAKQLTAALYGAPKEVAKRLVIAYEPIWAIGAKQAMSSHDMHTMGLFIKKVLHDFFEEEDVNKIPLLYGGSINDENSEDMLSKGEVDGLLIGRASLDAEQYGEILSIAEKLK